MFATRDIKWFYKRRIWRFFDSAGTQNQKNRGTNYFAPLISKNLIVQI